MGRNTNNESKMSLAVSRSESLRTTVPIHITQKLGLKKGDMAVWDMDKVNGTWVAILKKKEK